MLRDFIKLDPLLLLNVRSFVNRLLNLVFLKLFSLLQVQGLFLLYLLIVFLVFFYELEALEPLLLELSMVIL